MAHQRKTLRKCFTVCPSKQRRACTRPETPESNTLCAPGGHKTSQVGSLAGLMRSQGSAHPFSLPPFSHSRAISGHPREIWFGSTSDCPGHRWHHHPRHGTARREEELRKFRFLHRGKVSPFIIYPENTITWGETFWYG